MPTNDQSGQLYVVATPIGNLKDITLRAVETLRLMDYVACEDTRHSRPLLQHYNIAAELIALHQHNEVQRAQTLIDHMQAGKDIALITDAGTPLVSDPGARLIAQVVAAGITVVPIPGACAAVAALSVSGLLSDEFVFIGFLPAKGARREQALQHVLLESRTIVLYESVHRMATLLAQLQEQLSLDRQVVVARELTKRYESIIRGSITDVVNHFEQNCDTLRGEFVVLIEKNSISEHDSDRYEQTRVLQLLLQACSAKTASRLAAEITGGAKNDLYRQAIAMKTKE